MTRKCSRNPNGRFVNRPYKDSEEIDLYMKATGIVRRIEARVIITQKCDKAL